MANEERRIIHERSGVSAGMVTALVILAAVVIGLVVILLMRTNTTNNENLATQPAASPAQTTTTVQQPAQQPPVVVQQPAPAPGTTTNRTVVVKVPDDAAIQAEVERRIANAAALSRLGLSTTVSGGKVILVGRVSDRTLRAQAERLARGVTGVKTIDNQIIVVTRQP